MGTAVVGGLAMPLGILFASFANQLHQVLISYGIWFGLGCGLVRETNVLMVSQYFKRKRKKVEIISVFGSGLGVIIFGNMLDELLSAYGWRHGLQAIAGILSILFFVGM